MLGIWDTQSFFDDKWMWKHKYWLCHQNRFSLDSETVTTLIIYHFCMYLWLNRVTLRMWPNLIQENFLCICLANRFISYFYIICAYFKVESNHSVSEDHTKSSHIFLGSGWKRYKHLIYLLEDTGFVGDVNIPLFLLVKFMKLRYD